jgi:DNA-binding NarL/FixJ family response regulator
MPVYTAAQQVSWTGVQLCLKAVRMISQDNIRVLLIEKQALTRDALRALVESWAGFEVVGGVGTTVEALAMAAAAQPDIIVLDLSMGDQGSDALEMIAALRKGEPRARIIVLACDDSEPARVQAVLKGAVGVVPRGQPGSSLRKAIEKVHDGEVWLERSLTASVLREFADQDKALVIDPNMARIKSVSVREGDIIKLVCLGLSNRNIGERLSISEATVRHHLTSIYDKLELQNRLELVIFAYHNGLNKATGPLIPIA